MNGSHGQISELPLKAHGKPSVVLIVDDDAGTRFRLGRSLERMALEDSVEIVLVESVDAATSELLGREVDVILLDNGLIRADGLVESGIEAIPSFLTIRPFSQIIIYTGSKNTQDIVKAMNLGACGYVNKSDPEELLFAQIRRALSIAQVSKRNSSLERKAPSFGNADLVFASRSMKLIESKIGALAESDRPVLLLGETGTGKTAIGKKIHQTRSKILGLDPDTFQYFNIRQFQQTVVESELFGHEPGAFTGATTRKLGFCELANGGTLFIDEIGEATLDVQAKLLTVLSEGIFHRVGGSKEIHTSFKLLCATNRDLRQLVDEGLFREDLYYRICALELRVPSLVERKEDIIPLVKHLLPIMSEKNRVSVTFDELPQDYLKHVCDFPPKGNIRGLENSLTRLLVNSPRDKRGRCVFTGWEAIHNPSDIDQRAMARRRVLCSADIMELPFELSDEEFPGLDELVKALEHNVVHAAWQKFGTGKEVAKFLKRSASSVSTKYRSVLGRKAKKDRGAKDGA
jgi:DNA-binding NtrC family response regulator